MKLSIIIPVYNEKNTILEILTRIDKVNLCSLGFEKEIIIVDDGSTDETTSILKKLRKYKIIYHSENQGKGAAIRTGLKHVSGDYLIIQDADLEYDPKNYQDLLKYTLKCNALVVYGSRQLNRQNRFSHLSFYLGGVFLTKLTNFLYQTHITDESTCYKLFKTEIIKAIDLKCKRFEFCPEVTAKVAKKGITIHEIPIRYYARKKNQGKKINWTDGLEAIWTLIKYRFKD